MVIKAVSLFLIAILALAMFGRLKTPKLRNPIGKPKVAAARKCKKCGSYVVGDGPCACKKRG